jgi:hypothetical protein
MARRESIRPTALKVRVTVEPHRGTSDHVAHAYERVVPCLRRTVARNAPAAQLEAGHTQPVGKRNAS